ncbi:unnamed protein product [Rotaria socialis]|uniref:Uncharacterized protein n=1 Tax=Rotaria socialis TaxID=392032 RepID=A0A818TCF0_9BILA|nr:unnamed protein product [Rotaria socialis]
MDASDCRRPEHISCCQQQKLLSDTNKLSITIELQYKQCLQERLAQLDTEKNCLLVGLEQFLNECQETVFALTRQDID